MTYSISEVSKKFNISPFTLRFYDKQGLMPFVKRDAAGRRAFSDDDLDFVSLIICLKQSGLELEEIRQFVEMTQEGDATLAGRLEFFERQVTLAQERIEQQKQNIEKLKRKVQYYQVACDMGTEDYVKDNFDLSIFDPDIKFVKAGE